jgi:hypothetical protein
MEIVSLATIAPLGKLRVGVNLGNCALVRKDGDTRYCERSHYRAYAIVSFEALLPDQRTGRQGEKGTQSARYSSPVSTP